MPDKPLKWQLSTRAPQFCASTSAWHRGPQGEPAACAPGRAARPGHLQVSRALGRPRPGLGAEGPGRPLAPRCGRGSESSAGPAQPRGSPGGSEAAYSGRRGGQVLPCPSGPGWCRGKKLWWLQSRAVRVGSACGYLVKPAASEKSSPSSVLPPADKIFASARHGWRLPPPSLPYLTLFQTPPEARQERESGEAGGRRRCAGPRRSTRPPPPRAAPLPALLARPAGRRSCGCNRHGDLRQEERKPVSLPCCFLPPSLPSPRRRVPGSVSRRRA